MNKEASSNYDQADQTDQPNQFNYPQQPSQRGPSSSQLNYGQPGQLGQSRFPVGSGPVGQPGNQPPNPYASQPNYPYNNQVNQSNQWNPWNQTPNQPQDLTKMRMPQISDKQMAELRTCSRIGFWCVTLPAVASTYFYQRYRALKTLTPVSVGSILLGSTLAFFGSKLLVAPFCFRGIIKSSQQQFNEMNCPSNQFRNQQYGQQYGAPPFQPGAPDQQQPSNQLPFQQQQYLPYQQPPFQQPYQRQPPKNSPYLHPQFKEDNKEFAADSDEKDIGYDKEDDRNMLNKNF